MSLKNKRSRFKKRRIGLQKRKMAVISARNVALYRRKSYLFVFQDEMGFSNTLERKKESQTDEAKDVAFWLLSSSIQK
jgi:hypothetical protein